MRYFWCVEPGEGPSLNVVLTNGNQGMLLTPPLTLINDKCRRVRNESRCQALQKLALGGNAPQYVRFSNRLNNLKIIFMSEQKRDDKNMSD